MKRKVNAILADKALTDALLIAQTEKNSRFSKQVKIAMHTLSLYINFYMCEYSKYCSVFQIEPFNIEAKVHRLKQRIFPPNIG